AAVLPPPDRPVTTTTSWVRYSPVAVPGVDGVGAAADPLATPGSPCTAPSRPLLAAARDEEDGALEQDVHREPQDDRADDVGARRDRRREDRDPEDRHAARALQALRGHDVHAREPEQQDRELEDEAEGEEHRGDEVEVVARGDQRLEVGAREREQE